MKRFSTFKKAILISCSITLSTLSSGSVFGAEDLDAQRPYEMICSITGAVMQDPVVAADGHSYERVAIQEWFERSGGKSPSTGLFLNDQNLIPNYALKKMITEWIPGKHVVPSPLEQLESSVISERIQKEFTDHNHLIHSSSGKNIVVFLGNTGAGKSTLVNLLTGKELRVDEYGQGYTLANPDDQTAMPIGITGDSQTLYPKSIAGDNNLLFFDLPGFNDTDGSIRNLVNAAFIRQILIEANSVRFVFVAGEDEFTAHRGDPVKKMFDAIRLLFVTNQGVDLINNGIFVATKSMCRNENDSINYLLKNATGTNKEAIQAQLHNWEQSNRLCHVHHPVLGHDLMVIKDKILTKIKNTSAAKVLGINVSVLYPPETKRPLVRMFFDVMQMELDNQIKNRANRPLNTLTDYDHELDLFNIRDFWKRFDVNMCRDVQAVGLLKEFCLTPYNEAMQNFEKEQERVHQKHIQRLNERKRERVRQIEQITHQRSEEVINTLVPKQPDGNPIAFDFAYHKDFYEQVCGASFIEILAVDPMEQEIVRRTYAGFISEHSQKQMLGWYQHFIKPQQDEQIKGLKQQHALQIQKQDEQIKRLTSRFDNSFPMLPIAPVISQISVPPNEIIINGYIPPIARGREAEYQRFMAGSLIYRPNVVNAIDQIVIPIASIANPNTLEGTFDLSRFRNTSQYFSISSGFRKGKKAENKNKVEVWIVPKFIAEQNINGAARHLQPIMAKWTAPYGIFFNMGNWDNLDWFYYEVTKDIETINVLNLSKIESGSARTKIDTPGTIRSSMPPTAHHISIQF